MGGDSVILHSYGSLMESEPLEWPNGKFICDILKKENATSTHTDDPDEWQAAVRRALLRKFGYDTYDADIGKLWKAAVLEEPSSSTSSSSNNDLLEFLTTKCRWSNGRKLQWDVMKCAPGIQFRLHAHPNIEVVYCLQGELHEIRMQGEPFPIQSQRLTAPINLASTKRPWKFDTLSTDTWLVNEVGSVHKSFTGPSGCQLLVLWGGAHSDIDEPPASPNVQQAVDSIQNRLEAAEKCECSSNWENISETFLPDSEKASTLL